MGNGVTARVNLSMYDDYCCASSWAVPGMESASVRLSYTYGWGTQTYTVAGNGNTTTRPVSINAPSNHYGSVGIRANSSHVVISNSNTWRTSLRVG